MEKNIVAWVVFDDRPDPQCFLFESRPEAITCAESNWFKGTTVYLVPVTMAHQTQVGYWD